MESTAHMTKPDLYVVARILERLWREEGPILRTRLQVAVRLNYDIFTKYIDWMVEKGFVEYSKCSNEHEGIVITDKGMEAYKTLVIWINEYINQGRRMP